MRKKVLKKHEIDAHAQSSKAEMSDARHKELKSALEAVAKAIEKSKPDDLAKLLAEGNSALRELVKEVGKSSRNDAIKALDAKIDKHFEMMIATIAEMTRRPSSLDFKYNHAGKVSGVVPVWTEKGN